jgi:hypothetical protein
VTVSDLIFILRQQDPRAIVVVVDPSAPRLIAKLGVGEVQSVRLQATEDVDLVWLSMAEDGPLPGLLLGSTL